MRPRLVWTAFTACLLIALTAMIWVSATVLRLDAAEAAARRAAELEENTRLVLWRMDSNLAPLIARESTWPYFAWTSFYPAQRAYTNMLAPIGQGEVLMPSPLLAQPSPPVLVHFQLGPDNTLTSPQIPAEKMRRLAESGYTTSAAIAAAGQRLDRLRPIAHRVALAASLQAPRDEPPRVTVLPPDDSRAQSFDLPQRADRQQQQVLIQRQIQAPNAAPGTKSLNEYVARSSNILSNTGVFDAEQSPQQPASSVQEGLMQPLWMDGRLLLARRVRANHAEYIQGCWLDWSTLEHELCASVHDLLPEARLEPVQDTGPAAAQGRALAALPVRLIPGPMAASHDAGRSPLRMSLAIAWACMCLAAAAVAVLLQGAMSLSERRGAFVSAVTHEMRTPLTTFRMYTEMLVKGMVPEARRERYLDTLRVEGDRLSHLVENVLSYARLERGTSPMLTDMTVVQLLERVQRRLADRAEQAGMQLEVNDRTPEGTMVQTEPAAVEQILFNLVDNACKYAAAATERVIGIDVETAAGKLLVTVWDRGPGISVDRQRHLFRPFSKSAQQAAHSAPGIGLGLALSRRLARQLGGELRYVPASVSGARFVLELRARPVTEI